MSVLDQAIVKAYGKVAQSGRSAAVSNPAPEFSTSDAAGPSRSASLGELEGRRSRDSSKVNTRTTDQSLTTSATSNSLPGRLIASPEILYRPEWISPSQTSSVVPAPHIDFRLASLPVVKDKAVAPRIDPPHVATAAPLRAAFEVEAFVWPEVVQQMADSHETAFAPLLAELGELSGREQKLVAISGCRSGAGATTLLLALSQLLGKREVSTAVVDLEFWRPRLAEQLGIAPQTGWFEVLRGEQPVTEAMVESLKDQVTLMPLCGAVAADQLGVLAQLNNLLRTLSQSFDLVLLNVGPLQVETTAASSSIDIVGWLGKLQIDFALLVRDTRNTTNEEALTLGQRLTAAGVKLWHLAENYSSMDESLIRLATNAAPVTPARVASAPVHSAPIYCAPPASTAATTNSARPVAVAAISKSHEVPADWESTIVPPWKT